MAGRVQGRVLAIHVCGSHGSARRGCVDARIKSGHDELVKLLHQLNEPEYAQFLTVEAWWISSIDSASAALNSASLIETRRSWASALEKLAIMPWLAARR